LGGWLHVIWKGIRVFLFGMEGMAWRGRGRGQDCVFYGRNLKDGTLRSLPCIAPLKAPSWLTAELSDVWCICDYTA